MKVEAKLQNFQAMSAAQGMLVLALIEAIKVSYQSWHAGEMRYFGVALLGITIALNVVAAIYLKQKRTAILSEMPTG